MGYMSSFYSVFEIVFIWISNLYCNLTFYLNQLKLKVIDFKNKKMIED